MGITAENLAEKYQLTREDCDNYAYQTQQRWKAGKMGFVLRYPTHSDIEIYFFWEERLVFLQLGEVSFAAQDKLIF